MGYFVLRSLCLFGVTAFRCFLGLKSLYSIQIIVFVRAIPVSTGALHTLHISTPTGRRLRDRKTC